MKRRNIEKSIHFVKRTFTIDSKELCRHKIAKYADN